MLLPFYGEVGPLPLGTLPTGHGPVIGFTPDCDPVGVPETGAVGLEGEFEFEDPAVVFELFDAVVPAVLTQGLAGTTGVAGFCVVPAAPVAGVGAAPVGEGVSAVPLGGATLSVPSPAALVVIGVGGPIGLVGGVMLGLAGAAGAVGVGAGAVGVATLGMVDCVGVAVVIGVVGIVVGVVGVVVGAVGAGVAARVRCAAAQLAQLIRTINRISRFCMRFSSLNRHHRL